MKRYILVAVAALTATVNVNAQAGYDTKHEIGITYGFGCNSDVFDAFTKATSLGLTGQRAENTKHFGTISAEYFYHSSKTVGVGGILGYAQFKEDAYSISSDTKKSVDKESYFTIMPAVKFNWLRKNHFGMYSKLAAGISINNTKQKNENGSNSSDNWVLFNWQASVIGIEAGGATVRGFLELGIGEQGIGLAGIRYKF